MGDSFENPLLIDSDDATTEIRVTAGRTIYPQTSDEDDDVPLLPIRRKKRRYVSPVNSDDDQVSAPSSRHSKRHRTQSRPRAIALPSTERHNDTLRRFRELSFADTPEPSDVSSSDEDDDPNMKHKKSAGSVTIEGLSDDSFQDFCRLPVNMDKDGDPNATEESGWRKRYSALPDRSKPVTRLQHGPPSNRIEVRINNTYQISPDSNECFFVKSMYIDPGGQPFLKGWHLRASSRETRYFCHLNNEVYIIAFQDADKSDHTLAECQVVIELPGFMRLRSCTFGNDTRNWLETWRKQKQHGSGRSSGQLICRAIVLQKMKKWDKIRSTAIRFFVKDDLDMLNGQAIPTLELLQAWLGQLPDFHANEITYADMFAGGGGSARGAAEAGCRLVWVMDKDTKAAETLRKNFGVRNDSSPHNARVFPMSIDDFLAKEFKHDIQVDILWISPPCPEFSNAKRVVATINPKILTLGRQLLGILPKVRPRVIIMEQVPQIRQKFKGQYYHEYIQQLTVWGYQVRTDVNLSSSYGFCQTRERLFIVAVCPGETLPSMTPHTHGPPGSGLSPYTGVQDMLGLLTGVRLSAMMSAYVDMDETPYDAAGQLPTFIGTTGNIPHPSGKRSMNLAELLVIMTGNPAHQLGGDDWKARRKQIGNMVASMVSQTINTFMSAHVKASNAAFALTTATAVPDTDAESSDE